MEISHERRFEILRGLDSTTCEVCGKTKRRWMSHCRSCYYRLPPKMRSALYRPYGEGYEEAFEDSLRYLKDAEAA
jgi:hypothetical protein